MTVGELINLAIKLGIRIKLDPDYNEENTHKLWIHYGGQFGVCHLVEDVEGLNEEKIIQIYNMLVEKEKQEKINLLEELKLELSGKLSKETKRS